MLDTLFTLSGPRIYLLGVLLMTARTFWRSRPRKCVCCDMVKKLYVLERDDGTCFDFRYTLVILFGVLWPIIVLTIVATRLYSIFDNDDAHSA